MQMQNESVLDYAIRINEVLPDIHLGEEEKSERSAKIKRLGTNAITSCSLFLFRHRHVNHKSTASGNTSPIISNTLGTGHLFVK